MKLLSRLYAAAHPVLRSLRSHPRLIRMLFGVQIPRGTPVQFDPTTICLSRTLRKIATENDRRTLEVGIGQAALVSLSLAKQRPVEVYGVDLSASRVASSIEVAKYNGIKADFRESDLLSAVPNDLRFDLIFFNPPYVPTAMGQQLQFNERFCTEGNHVWDGGVDGTDVLVRFLRDAKPRLTPTGRIVFGVQSIFIPDALIVEVLKREQMELKQRCRQRVPPSVCYVVV